MLMINPQKRGYTLLEQAISITILSVMLVMFLLLQDRQYYARAYVITQKKIKVIDRAIIAKYLEFSALNTSTLNYHLFACSAPISKLVTDKDFGISIDDDEAELIMYSCRCYPSTLAKSSHKSSGSSSPTERRYTPSPAKSR